MLIYYISYAKANSVRPSYLTRNYANGYIEESNGNQDLVLILTDESKGTEKG